MTAVDEPDVAGSEPADAGGGPSQSSRIAPFVALGVAIVVLGLVVVMITALSSDEPNEARSPLIGNAAPEATATNIRDGSFFDLSRRKGSWVVLNFFRSDCVPCIQEHPDLIEFVDQQRQLPDGGAELYSIAVGDTEERALDFFEQRGGDWPVLFSEGDSFSVAFGVAAVPETWIIDPNGVVLERFISTVNADFLSVTLQQWREATGL